MKLLKIATLSAVALSVVACTNTLNRIDRNGVLENPNYDELYWPKIEDATQPEGIFPETEDLYNVGAGVTKKDLYYMFERPHFSEMNGAHEWNYIFKFRQADRSVKICQYKVLFDKNEVAQNFYWLPKDCLTEKFDLAADALFPFDRGALKDIKEEGKSRLDELAAYVTKLGNKTKLRLIGHTDYLGNDMYNQRLSEQRAASVARYLEIKGVNGKNISTAGMGERQPIKNCSTDVSRRALKDCLQPNRRVSVEIIKR
ncbi:MAG: OmpA family protein [Gammaproteobacteria bacterium]|nr:OmpA family protein [Gammaproteobacteria bacterium]